MYMTLYIFHLFYLLIGYYKSTYLNFETVPTLELLSLGILTKKMFERRWVILSSQEPTEVQISKLKLREKIRNVF